ncbi:T9SS type A sorting domain-containing protein [Aequorivita sp. 609]|uniref:T9SS type A sorting domain-containing protein n=1 Tax=Aequorivita TaxID=153265 RepID=UPI00161AE270|nr:MULTISPECIES: T9SS type A sorting domain-containing protein [Aequorivita]MBB6681432.1 T9SS type A sorting domain-containing protein [Aequorivita sp. 609]
MTLTIKGETTASLIGTPTKEGTYPVTLMLSDGNSSEQQYFEVEVVDSGEVDWHVVGQEGFTDGIAYDLNLEINSIGVPYVMSANSNNEISVYTYENDSWSLLGNKITGEQGQAAMALAPDSTPYIITINGLLKVYKYDGSNWNQVGGTVGNGYHMDITVANDGTPYVSYMDVTNNTRGICKKWDGSNWVIVGDTHFTASQVAVWTKLATNSNNQPVVLYGTGSDPYGPKYSNVSRFNGSSWEVIGGTDIDSSNETYFSHSLAIDENDNIYVGATVDLDLKKLNVYKWNGASWSNIGDNIGGGATYSNSIALDLQGNPVIGFRDEVESGKTTVMRYDGSIWSSIGLTGFTNIASYQSLAYSPNGHPYIAYQDEGNNSLATVKRYGDATMSIGDFTNNNFNIVVYPNPNSGHCTVLSNNNGKFQLFDIQGRVISEGIIEIVDATSNNYTYTFNHSNLSKGLYLLSIANEQKR